jgi:heptosyltransferase-2
MKKVLIIKLGYSETLDPEVGKVSSLGDVMRTTVLLHAFRDCRVTWYTDESAYPLLRNNPYIDRILFFNLTTILQLQVERFDIVINLEKVPGICALTESIHAWAKYGFRYDPVSGDVCSYEGSHEALRIYTDITNKRHAAKNWQEVLYEMVGKKWNGEEYVLGYIPKSDVIYDVGLNYRVGTKWPNKVWDKENWDGLYYLLKSKGYKVAWQAGTNNIDHYMEWINSCRVIVTHDSLGLHLAIGLKKRVVALFGPTCSHEAYLYSLGTSIVPEGIYDCVPCLNPTCSKETVCMSTISVESVCNETERILNCDGLPFLDPALTLLHS